MSEVDGAGRRFFQDVWNNGDVSAAGTSSPRSSSANTTLDVTVLGPTDDGRAVPGYRRGVPDLITTLEDVVAAGDRVAVRGTDRGTHRGGFMGPTSEGPGA